MIVKKKRNSKEKAKKKKTCSGYESSSKPRDARGDRRVDHRSISMISASITSCISGFLSYILCITVSNISSFFSSFIALYSFNVDTALFISSFKIMHNYFYSLQTISFLKSCIVIFAIHHHE